jgi:hypothetical protein
MPFPTLPMARATEVPRKRTELCRKGGSVVDERVGSNISCRIWSAKSPERICCSNGGVVISCSGWYSNGGLAPVAMDGPPTVGLAPAVMGGPPMVASVPAVMGSLTIVALVPIARDFPPTVGLLPVAMVVLQRRGWCQLQWVILQRWGWYLLQWLSSNSGVDTGCWAVIGSGLPAGDHGGRWC